MKKFVFACLLAVSLFSLGMKTDNVHYIKLPEGFARIPSGSFKYHGKPDSVQSFYISKTEISNAQYHLFLDDLKKNGTAEEYKKAMVDTLKWRDVLSYNEPFVKYYFQHPAYSDYPVVNITREAAEMYCHWLTQQYENKYHIKLKAAFRLPAEAEWMWAAHGGRQFAVYAWGGPYLRNAKGRFLCNFSPVWEENIHREKGKEPVVEKKNVIDMDFDNSSYITAPVVSYWPNDYGLYDMCGNVAEMVNEKGLVKGGSWQSGGYDVRIESIDSFNEACNTVGFRPVITVVVQ